MTERSRKFKAKMRACGTIARAGGVVAAASLAIVSKGYGEALRFQLDDHIPPYTPGPQTYDLDGDGNGDVSFDVSSGFAVFMEAERFSYGGGIYQTCVIIMNESGAAKGHEAGILINNLYQAGYSVASLGDEFYAPSSPRYAGFHFVHDPDSTLHMAWMELAVTGTFETGYGLDVIAYGYETDPGVGILTGYPEAPLSVEHATWGEIKALFDE